MLTAVEEQRQRERQEWRGARQSDDDALSGHGDRTEQCHECERGEGALVRPVHGGGSYFFLCTSAA